MTIPVASGDTNQGTVSTSSLTFTPANWNVPQTVTATGADDHIANGNQSYTVTTGPASSADGTYNGLSGATVSLTNINHNTVGIDVAPTTGLQTDTNGGTAAFTVTLNSAPTADVTIPVASSDTSQGTVSTSSLTFTPANWNVPQTVTATGADDHIANGNQSYTVTTGPASSADGTYNGLSGATVSLTNINHNTAGIDVAPTSGLQTDTNGGTAAFSVTLNSKPTANVTIPVASSDTSQGTVSTSSLTFTPANWNVSQTVTVTGADNQIADGNQGYTVTTGPASSADVAYNGQSGTSVSLTNVNYNTAGIDVAPASGLQTDTSGSTASFTATLNSKPTADVTIPVASSDTNQGTVSTPSLTFTPANWNVPQTVTVTGADDHIADGNQSYTVTTGPASSADGTYSGLSGAAVSLTNINHNTAGIDVAPTSGLQTDTHGGTAAFNVTLNSKPTANVTIPVGSSDANQGTVSTSSLTFTPANWNVPQTVTVTGADDHIANGNQSYTVTTGPASSADGTYSGLSGATVSLTNINHNTAGINVAPTAGLQTDTNGGTAAFNVTLNSKPTADVTVPVASSDTSQGTVSTSSLTFTPADWNVPQTVTATGADDHIANGNQSYTVTTGPASSADGTYNGLSSATVSLTNINHNTAGINVAPTAGLQTDTNGGTAAFNMTLNSKPTADVTVPVASSDTSQGTVSTSSLTFTPADWNVPQTVTATGVNDFIADGNQTYAVTTGPASSADATYNGLSGTSVSLTNINHNTAGINVAPTCRLQTDTNGGTAAFNVTLNSKPTANVTIPVASSDTSQGTVSKSSLTFTPADWNVPQTVTVTGADDHIADGNQSYTVTTGPASSADGTYNGMSGARAAVTNVNHNVASISVSPTSGLTTSQAGGTAAFSVVLTSRPLADVTVPIVSSDDSQGTVSTPALIFTAADWNVPQTVMVTGADNHVAAGNQAYSIAVGPASSGDAGYFGLAGATVSLVNQQTDIPGITVAPTSDLFTTADGGTASFTVVLNTEPVADVTLPLSISNAEEASASVPSVTFTPADWNMPQTVTLTGLALSPGPDGGGMVPYTVDFAPASSADANYAGMSVPGIPATNFHPDLAPAVTLSPGDISYVTGVPPNAPEAIDPGLTVSDADNASLQSAAISIGSGYDSSEDVLSVAAQIGISAQWDSFTGTLFLSGPAPVAAYQAELQSVSYENSSDIPGLHAARCRFLRERWATGQPGRQPPD